MHDGICRENSESCEGEEVLSCMLDFAKCLLALCSSSSACRAEKLIFVLYREGFDERTFVEHVSSLSDCKKITDGMEAVSSKG